MGERNSSENCLIYVRGYMWEEIITVREYFFKKDFRMFLYWMNVGKIELILVRIGDLWSMSKQIEVWQLFFTHSRVVLIRDVQDWRNSISYWSLSDDSSHDRQKFFKGIHSHWDVFYSPLFRVWEKRRREILLR